LMDTKAHATELLTPASRAGRCYEYMTTDHGRHTLIALFVANEIEVPSSVPMQVTAEVVAAGRQHGIEVQIGQGDDVSPIERYREIVGGIEGGGFLGTSLGTGSSQDDLAAMVRDAPEGLWPEMTREDAESGARLCSNHRGEVIGHLWLHNQHSNFRLHPPDYSIADANSYSAYEMNNAQIRRLESSVLSHL